MEGSNIQAQAEALQGASETLLIPLACRARGSRDGVNGFIDTESERLAERLGIDLDRYAVNRSMLLGVIHRGSFFDQRCLDFLNRHPQGTILNLGAGLNTAYERMRGRAKVGGWSWIDTDLEPVVALRAQVLEDGEQRRTQALDVSDIDAFRAMLGETQGPLLVISEAVLIYVNAQAVGEVFKAVGDRGDAEFIFDWVSPEMMRNSRKHPAMKRLRDESVAFASCLRRASDIKNHHANWRIVAETGAPMPRSGFMPAVMAAVFSVINLGRRIYGCAHARLA